LFSFANRSHGLAALTGVLYSLLAIQIIKRLRLTPANTERATFDNGLTLAVGCRSFGIGTGHVINEGTVGAMRANQRSELAKLAEESAKGVFGEIILHACYE
jgi:hypothetical protein